MAKEATPDRGALEKISGWADAEPGVSVAPDGTITVEGERPLQLTVTADDERVQLTHRHLEHGADQARLDQVRRNLPGRGAAVTATVAAAADDLEATFTSTIYIDGLTRQGFVASFNELIAATDRALGPVIPATAAANRPVTPPAATDADTAETAPAAVPLTAAGDTAPTMILDQVWMPTHRVASGGLRAWSVPDPATDPIATLQARVELSIAERRSDWARVIGSNGWTGWVDARRLEVMAAPGGKSAAAARSGGFPIGAIGALALGLAAILPWYTQDGETADAFQFPIDFLWSLQPNMDLKLGVALVGLAAIGLLVAVLPGIPGTVRRFVGTAGVAIPVVYVLQVYRLLDTSLSDTLGFIGFGTYVALAGALVMLLAPRGRVTP